jgi:hypothetical protein
LLSEEAKVGDLGATVFRIEEGTNATLFEHVDAHSVSAKVENRLFMVSKGLNGRGRRAEEKTLKSLKEIKVWPSSPAPQSNPDDGRTFAIFGFQLEGFLYNPGTFPTEILRKSPRISFLGSAQSPCPTIEGAFDHATPRQPSRRPHSIRCAFSSR